MQSDKAAAAGAEWPLNPVFPGIAGLGSDLSRLALELAELTAGMVSIEDDRARMLGYSPSDDSADELRRLSILGRECPAEYRIHLNAWGVYDQLRRSGDVVEVPAKVDFGVRRRLAIAMQGSAPGHNLGTIWVQEGTRPLADDAARVLRGAAAVAARMIIRTLNAPNAETIQIERLLGGRGGGIDAPSLAASLGIPATGPAVVIGFAGAGAVEITDPEALAATVRLHAGAYAADALVGVIGRRLYLLLPRVRGVGRLESWTRGVIARIERQRGVGLRAAIGAPVADLTDVSAARSEVDRVLDQTTGDELVTTLAASRTPVLLGEMLDLLAGHPELHDPRIAALVRADQRGSGDLRRSVHTYLRHFGDVRHAAAELQIHPNTLRYRLRRAQQILDIDLTEPAGRLLVELQLAVIDRTHA